jgi:hypothetical protein
VRAVKALHPYLDQLVFVGAWCHRLLLFHPRAIAPSFTPLVTEDADLAVPEKMPARKPSIAAALKSAGFEERLIGSERPVTKYFSETGSLYVEFIAPLRGGPLTRRGEPNDILSIAGIAASKLRYVDLLLFEPWKLGLSDTHGFAVDADDLVIQIANPASYLAQKVLTLNRRLNRVKRVKDALYLHDTLVMFADAFDELREQASAVLHLLPPKTARDFQQLRADLFRDEDLVVRAATMAAATGRANPPSAETIAAVCTYGLEQIFARRSSGEE